MNPTEPEDYKADDSVPTEPTLDSPEADTTNSADQRPSTDQAGPWTNEQTVTEQPTVEPTSSEFGNDAQTVQPEPQIEVSSPGESLSSTDLEPQVFSANPQPTNEVTQTTPESFVVSDQPQEPGKSETVAPFTVASTPVSESSPTKRSSKKLFVTIAVSLLALVLIGGGAVLAYFGAVVPNQPENVLKTSVFNTLESDLITYDGTLQLAPRQEGSIPATNVAFLSQNDAKNQATAATLDITISGIDFNLEARMLDGIAYIKLGDLMTIKDLASTWLGVLTGPNEENAAAIDALIEEADGILSNQWILIDSTLIDQAGASCVTETQFTLNDQDRTILQEQFENNPFVTIDNHSDDTVAGVDSIKYELTIDNKKGAQYAESIEKLSVFSALQECDIEEQVVDTETNPETLLASDTTKLSVWVDKDAKRLNKIVFDDIAVGEEEQMTVSLESELRYDTFTVEAPAESRPAVQVIRDLSALIMRSSPGLESSL